MLDEQLPTHDRHTGHSEITPTMVEAEKEWELVGVRAGAERFRREMDRSALSETKVGVKISRLIMPALVDKVLSAQAEAHEAMGHPKRGRPVDWWFLITLLPADVLSVITLKTIFNATAHEFASERTVTSVALAISRLVQTQIEFDAWKAREAAAKKADPQHYSTFDEFCRITTTVNVKAYQRYASRVELLRAERWTNEMSLGFGCKLIALLIEAKPDWFLLDTRRVRGFHLQRVLRLSDECWAHLAELTEQCEVSDPVYLPMIYPPAPWTWEPDPASKGKGRYAGGYYLLHAPMLKVGLNRHTAHLRRPVGMPTVRALNAVQATPWRVNQNIYRTMLDAYDSGLSVGGLPFGDPEPLPRKSDEDWARMTSEDRSLWKKSLTDLHNRNASLVGKRKGFLGQVRLARMVKDRAAFWFPHSLDFRTRFYPVPQDLHPQANDIGKSLLQFATAKPLGERGLFWLSVRLANDFGYDKVGLPERVEWVRQNFDAILDSGDDPLDGERFWLQADEPWCFLAGCMEIAAAFASGDMTTYPSSLPVQLDGSCNGLQHLSAMARDPFGAKMTNVAANAERHDIYMTVAEIVRQRVSAEAAAGDPLAHEWVGRIDRKTVKRAVMTTPYGVTARGISTQLVKDGHCGWAEHKRAAANYLRDCIEAALDQTITCSKQVMLWMQTCAQVLAEQGQPYRFRTPAGNTVQQSYYDFGEVRVNTLAGKMTLLRENAEGELRVGKQTQAAAPNTIHAFDAGHMALTINRMEDEIDHPSYSMIHDSYGCHAADVDIMTALIRETFVDIYEINWLERLEDDLRRVSSRTSHLIPDHKEFVTVGDFNVSDVLRSEFFFA